METCRGPVDHGRAEPRVELAGRLRGRLLTVRRFRACATDTAVPPPASTDSLDVRISTDSSALRALELLDHSHTGVAVHLRQDDRPLLDMPARAVGVGVVRDHPAYPPTQPSATWRVSRLDDVAQLAGRLNVEQMRGRKAAELDVRLRAVAARRAARASGRRPELDRLIAEFRAARGYRPRSAAHTDRSRQGLARPGPADPAALGAGRVRPLSCTRYAAARRPDWPTRNTVARTFDLDAALLAAGLEDRLPRRRSYRVGGAANREARAQAQRERVLATLRYAVTVQGSVPTAMRFFRWRLINAPATPTQATVYRLFPRRLAGRARGL